MRLSGFRFPVSGFPLPISTSRYRPRMSIAVGQKRTFLRLLGQLRAYWRRDPALPARIHSLFAAHREFGSRDRRLYRELIYTTLRYLPWVEPLLDSQPEEAVRRVAWLSVDNPLTKSFRAAFATGDPPMGDKAELLPAWFRSHCAGIFSGAELDAQLRRAPLWLRLQTDQTGEARVLEEFAAHEWQWRNSPVLPTALELLTEADVTKTEAWREGQIEVQDLGSQLILASVGVAPGGRWLDACAGAGGKTLQLAQLLGPAGQVDAFDIRPGALTELERRAQRARRAFSHPLVDKGLAPIRVLQSSVRETYEGVLIDAPCSGSGTWRRAPHLKWVTTPAQIDRAAETQLGLLDEFRQRVQPGGRLVYVTCSLSSRENENVMTEFLAKHDDFMPEPFASTFGASPRGAGLPPPRTVSSASPGSHVLSPCRSSMSLNHRS
jgi:16S rRNA (cytosine967-C5)-methyltransferase